VLKPVGSQNRVQSPRAKSCIPSCACFIDMTSIYRFRLATPRHAVDVAIDPPSGIVQGRGPAVTPR
jgi:hypothetical protein